MRGAFVEACDDQRLRWRVDGTFSFGNSYGDMDRFETRIDGAGDLIIDTSQRTCTRSKGVPGIPPLRDDLMRRRPVAVQAPVRSIRKRLMGVGMPFMTTGPRRSASMP